MSGQIQTLATPPPVSVQTLLYNIYLAAASGGSGGASWGSITGTLSAQTDLQSALDTKLNLAGGTMTGALVNSTNGAASTPALLGNGTIFSGGTATTTKPYWLIEPAGTTSTGWSPSGTGLGVNAPSGFAGNLADFQLDGSPKCTINKDGTINTASSFLQFGPATYFKKLGNNMRWYGNGSLFEAFGFSIITGASDTADIGFARTSAGVGRISNGSTGRGTLDAAGYQVGGVAGTSGTITAASTVTVVNGIVTVIA